MDAAQIRCPLRLTRLLAALTIALSWLTLLGLPRLGLAARRLARARRTTGASQCHQPSAGLPR